MKKRLTLAALAVMMLLDACSGPDDDAVLRRENGNLLCVNLDVLGELMEPVSRFSLEDVSQPLGEIRLGEEPETFIKGRADFGYFDDKSVLVSGSERVIRVSLADGSLLNEYGRKGRGPGEYVQEMSAFAKDGKVYVTDIISKVHIYDADGEFLEERPLIDNNSQFNSLGPLEGGLFLIVYSSLSYKKQLYDVVDKDLKPVRTSSLKPENSAAERKWTDNGGIRLGKSIRFGDQDCVVLGDTLYRVTAKRESPCLYYLYQKDKLNRKTVIQSGHWLFVEAAYNDHDVHAVLDTRRSDVVFLAARKKTSITVETPRGPMTVPALDNTVENGLPIEWDGQTHYVWPVMADRGLLICQDQHASDNYYCFRLK